MDTPEAIKERGAHFTPTDIAFYIAENMYMRASKNDIPHHVTILDPSCGDGELLAALYSVAKDHGHQVNLIGVEMDRLTIENANKRLSSIISPDDTFRLLNTDFLLCEPTEKQRLFFDDQDPLNNRIPLVDFLIANPPYVRTQVMGAETTKALSAKYGLKGKTDLYHAFFLAYSTFLKDEGVLGVITSNRYLYTKSGADVRKHVSETYAVEKIVDLGDTKIFSAAVLPAILIAEKKSRCKETPTCIRVYETPATNSHLKKSTSISGILRDSSDGIYQVGNHFFKRESGHIRNYSEFKEPWILASSEQEKWLDRVNAGSMCTIGDIAHVRVGIKTNADNVFIQQDWMKIDEPIRPEREWTKPLFSSEDACRWFVKNPLQLSALYPHYVEQGKRKAVDLDQFPKMKAYLESYKEQLSARSYVLKANRNWYEIWVPQNPDAWRNPKVIFPDISSSAKFVYDESGCLVDGNCYWVQMREGIENDWLFLIMGVANSKVMEQYHALAFQNVLYSGKRRYLTQYVNKYPLPSLSSESSQAIIALIRDAISSNTDVDESTINHLVEKSFDLV